MNAHPRPRPGMARISLFGIAAVLMPTGIAAWASSSHAVKAAIVPAQIDPFPFSSGPIANSVPAERGVLPELRNHLVSAIA
jgi:hypothetical protein